MTPNRHTDIMLKWTFKTIKSILSNDDKYMQKYTVIRKL